MDKFLTKIWGAHRLYIDENLFKVIRADVAALILCIHSQNFEKFKSLVSFKEILSTLGSDIGIYGVQSLQIAIINAIKKQKISKFETLLYLEILKNENIISKDEFSFISEFLYSINSNDENVSFQSDNFVFTKQVEVLNDIADKLENICAKTYKIQNDDLLSRIKTVKLRANENDFTLSVTGVINAGKSSMLNALMNFDILGASNIPETANLTLLKYGESSNAKVKFYDEKEIKILGLNDEYAQFLAQNLKNNLNEEIIDIKNLKNYTSAQYEISKFVKLIELNVQSEFLKNNICVVDTPGLDDTVVLREELTKKFMYSSDAIIHLMNAAQSATKKDIDFIVSTLKNSKNNALIIVLTHADLLSQKELFDALSYTRRCVADELKEYGFDENLIENVSYFCIDSVSKRGINELKSALYDKFFGSNKADEILKSYKKELTLIIDEMNDNFTFESSNLSSDKDELANLCSKTNSEILVLNENLEKFQNELNQAMSRLNYAESINFSAIKTAQIAIKDRILADVSYAKNRKQKPDLNRVQTIAQSGINDAIIDVFRTFSQKIAKDIENVKETLGRKFTQIQSFKFDTKKFFDENFAMPDFTDFDISLHKAITQNLDLAKLSVKLDEIFNDFIKLLDLQSSFQKVALSCTSEFSDCAKEIFEAEKNRLNQSASLLEATLAKSSNQAIEASKRNVFLKGKISELSLLKQRITQC